MHVQTPFEIERRFHRSRQPGPELDIRWVAYFAVTNLTDHPIVIEEFEPDFNPSDTRWQLRYKHTGVLQVYVADNEKLYRDHKQGSSELEPLLQVGSVMLGPRSKRYCGFYLSFDVYHNGEETVLTDPDRARELVQLAIGGSVDDQKRCRVAIGSMNALLRLSDGTALRFTPTTLLAVSGCVMRLE